MRVSFDWATLISRALRRTGWSRWTDFKRRGCSQPSVREIFYSPFHKIAPSLSSPPPPLFIFPSALSAHSLSTSNSPAAMASTVVPDQFQHVLVMRHGHRSDMGPGVDRSWWTTVPRPWDAPLSDEGRNKALDTGKDLRAKLEFPIHRVVTSPFLRCVETARELIAGLSMADGDSADSSSSRIKVSIEYGMCEILNDISLWHHPTDHDSWGFDIKELEASFPPGVADPAPHQVYKEMPQWGESESGARDRYLHTIHSLVDRYPQENLLFVTHGEGVKVMASTYWKDARGHELRPDYFGESEDQRGTVREQGSTFPWRQPAIVHSFYHHKAIGCNLQRGECWYATRETIDQNPYMIFANIRNGSHVTCCRKSPINVDFECAGLWGDPQSMGVHQRVPCV